MNAREFEILNLLSKREAASRPVPRPVQLAIKPGAPAIPEMVAVAAGSASEDVAARVRAYCAHDSEYAEMLATYERFFQRAEVEETQAAGSILAEMTVKNLVEARTPAQPRPVPRVKADPLATSHTSSGGGWTAFGGTLLAQSQSTSDHKKLLDKLEQWLPVLQRDLELPPHFDPRAFVDFARKQLPLTSGQRFRDQLPEWLAEFTKRPAGSLLITPEMVASAAVMVAAQCPESSRPGLAAEVNRFLLAHRLPHPDAILAVEFPEGMRTNPALSAYTFDLHRDASRIYREGMELFDYAQSA